jgi:Ca-activated chloride channel family protein
MTLALLLACALVRTLDAVIPENSTGAPHMVLERSADGATDPLLLKENLAEVEIAGVVANVRLTQRYQNTGLATLHATYVFPGSTQAAVHAMRMTLGTRVVRALLKERKAAQSDFARARDDGKTASLLTQERPNVFTMRVANIQPSDVVTVELEYTERIRPTDGVYSFTLPAVVGPRFQDESIGDDPPVPAGPLSTTQTHRHDVAVHLLAPLPLQQVQSPTHAIGVQQAQGVTHVVLDANEQNPGNRDFVLRYRLSGGAIQAGVLVHQGAPHNTLLALIPPPARVADADLTPREYVFVVDVSGSMQGEPLATAAALLEKLVAGLGREDTFNLVLFESGAQVLAPQSVRATSENVRRAVSMMDTQNGGGGTQLLHGLKTALDLPRTAGVSRTVLVITDGYVHVEASAMRLVQSHLHDMNVFAFGIGRAVNHHLIEGLARAGRGEPFVVLTGQDARAGADRFWEYVRSPVMTDIKVRFEGLEVEEVSPVQVPDVFANRPVEVMAHFRGAPRGEVVVTGSTRAGPVELRVAVPSAQEQKHPALPLLWARQRIQDLTDAPPDGEDALQKAVLPVALEHGVLSAFTAFVAVDERARGTGDAITVEQPSALPAGMSPLTGSAMGGIGALGGFGSGGGGTGYGYGGLGGRSGKAHVDAVLPPRGASFRSVGHAAAPPVVVAGAVSKEAIQRVIQAHQSELKHCYERERSQTPSLAGRLVLRFTLTKSGGVTDVTVTEDTLGSPALSACVVQRFAAFRFPGSRASGKVVVSYPLVFKPGQ